MNKEAQEYLDAILKKSPGSLTQPEKVFLKARRGYLKPSQLEEYKSVLEEEVVVEVVETEVNDAEPPTYLSTKDLKVKAESLEIDTKGKNRQELEDLIKQAENK